MNKSILKLKKYEKGLILDGNEGRNNFHQTSVNLERLQAFRAKDYFLNWGVHPEFYGVISNEKIPTLCGIEDCTCGCSISRERINASLRKVLVESGFDVPADGVIVVINN